MAESKSFRAFLPKLASDMRSRQRGVVYLLLGIFIAALILRIWGITFGLPYLYHFDEHFYVNTALHLGRGVINNPPYNPTGLANLLFPQYAFYFIAGKFAGSFPSATEFEAAYRADPSTFFVLGRMTTAVFGAATTFAVFLLGRALAGAKTGLVAAGFLAVSFLHVRDSHYAVPDIVMTFFVVLAVSLSATGLRQSSRRKVYLAGLAGGLAVAMKWTALPVIAPVLWAAFLLEESEHDTVVGRIANRTTVLTGLALAFGFALASPQILINPEPYLRHLQGVQQGGQPNAPQEAISNDFTRWTFYGETLLYGLGPILTVLGIAGAFRRSVLAVFSRDPMSVLVVAFLPLYLPLISRGFAFARYLLPIVPFLILFAADTVVGSLRAVTVSHKPGLKASVAGLAIIVSAAQPVASSLRHDLLLTREDTRTAAKRWIEANLPEGSKIAMDWPVHGPPLSTAEKAIPNSNKVYDVHFVGGRGLFAHPISWYEEKGFDYLVVSTYISNNLGYGGANPAKRAYYESLGEQLTLLQEFRHYPGEIEPPFSYLDEIYGPTDSVWRRIRPGPTIRVYGFMNL